jgi:hypothetical protein
VLELRIGFVGIPGFGARILKLLPGDEIPYYQHVKNYCDEKILKIPENSHFLGKETPDLKITIWAKHNQEVFSPVWPMILPGTQILFVSLDLTEPVYCISIRIG